MSDGLRLSSSILATDPNNLSFSPVLAEILISNALSPNSNLHKRNSDCVRNTLSFVRDSREAYFIKICCS